MIFYYLAVRKTLLKSSIGDGIFDKLSNEEVIKAVWQTPLGAVKSVHDFTGKAIENVMKLSLQRKSFDNVTVVMLGF